MHLYIPVLDIMQRLNLLNEEDLIKIGNISILSYNNN